jgi:hypothetical protein
MVNSEKIRDHLLQVEKKIVWHDVDLFSTMRGLPFHQLAQYRESSSFQGIPLSIISKDHLLLSKRLALQDPERSARWHEDQQDIECLERQRESAD